MATQKLASWISSLTFSDLPASVVDTATRSFENSLGCIVGGSTHPTTQKAIKAFQPGLTRSCTCLGQSYAIKHHIHAHDDKETDRPDIRRANSTDLSHAVLINGIASHVHDYDDTHLYTVIHPAGAIVVSLLAYAEHLKATSEHIVTGKELLTALVVGIEISLRLGNSISPEHYNAGWHITGTVSPLGVAAALSNLLHLTPDVTSHALGIASTQPTGIRVHFGSDTKAFHVGRAAQNGILAVQLSQAGFTAANNSLEGRRGWVEVLGHTADTLDAQIKQLLYLTSTAKVSDPGQPSYKAEEDRWEIEKNTFKPFPCGIVIHPIIDACIQLHNEHDLSSQSALKKIESVKLKVHHLVLDLTGKKLPRDGLEAKFSVYHGAAIGLIYGTASPAEYDDDIVSDPRVVSMRERVAANVDDSIRSDECFVILRFSDGQEVVKHVEHAVGSLKRPMTVEELKRKFAGQVASVLGDERSKEVDKLAWCIKELEDVTVIAEVAR